MRTIWPCQPTSHNWSRTSGFHSKVDLWPVWAPEPFWGDCGAAAIGVKHRRRWVQGNDPFRQHGPHVERIEKPDQTEYAEANRDVNEDFANVCFLFLLFAVKCRGLVIFPERWGSFTSHPLPLSAHSTWRLLDRGRERERDKDCKITISILPPFVHIFLQNTDDKNLSTICDVCYDCWKIYKEQHMIMC